MATFKENLEKIEKAVYGKDVRTAIHDSIEQCMKNMQDGVELYKSYVNDMYTMIRNLTQYISNLENVIISATSSSWEYISPDLLSLATGVIWYVGLNGGTSLERTVGGSSYQCAKISVNPGEVYRIRTYTSSGMVSASDAVYVGYNTAGANIFSDGNYKKIDVYIADGWDEFLVTIPEGYNYLLINSNGATQGDIHAWILHP